MPGIFIGDMLFDADTVGGNFEMFGCFARDEDATPELTPGI